MSGLCIAVCNGALLQDSCAVLAAAGIADVSPEAFEASLLVEAQGQRLVRIRPTDVPVYVEMGAAHCGIVGKDVLWETHRELYELVDLRFGACRMVLAAPEGSALAAGRWPAGLRVATKYPRTAQRFFDRMGVAAELIKLHGSVELAPVTGLADAVLDVTATGRTLRAHRLVEVAEVGRSTARLVANLAALKTRSAEVERLASALRRAVAAAADRGAA